MVNMTSDTSLQQTISLEIERALQQAVVLHQSGQLQLAEALYLAILKLDPNHPDANHNLGVLAVKNNQFTAALPFFLAALNADPTQGLYWISYIDTLFKAGQTEDARQVLALARHQVLAENEVNALALRLESSIQKTQFSDTTVDKSVATPKISKKTPPKAQPATRLKKHLSTREISTLSALLAKGQYAEAASIARIMTEHFPFSGLGWKALGIALIHLGQHAEALAPMQKTVELLPSDFDAHNNLGNILHNLGRLEEAEYSYRRVLTLKPNYAEVHCNLGNNLGNQGKLKEAEASYNKALQLKPDHTDALNNLGNMLLEQGKFSEAEISFRRILQIKPDCAQAHNNLSIALKKQARLDEALASAHQAVKFNPAYADAYNNLGGTLRDLGKLDEAASSFRQALQIKPNFVEASSNLGGTLRELGQLDEAMTWCRHALTLNPAFAGAYSNMAGVHKELGQLDEAIANCRRAIEIDPSYFYAYSNLGSALETQGEFEAAITSFRQALTLKPDFQAARMNLGFAQLACGQLTEGWKNHEFRTSIDRKRFIRYPYWTGENLAGKSILIWGEQGIGDELMFASQFAEIIAQADHCVIECTAKLVPLFIRSFPDAHIVPKLNPPHAATQIGFDYQCAAGSLAQWQRPNIASFPQQNSYLRPDPARVAYWKQRLAELGPGPKIGFCWRSSLTTGVRTLHYTTLNQWKPIFIQTNVHFINLQYDECSAELDEARQRFGVPIHSFPEVDMYNNLDETAALIQALDLVISAPTAVSAIAAAQGVNTWVMNYGISWEIHGTDRNPWFPSLQHFVRQWNQSWNEIIQSISLQLQLYVDGTQPDKTISSQKITSDASLQQTIRQEIDNALSQAIVQHQSGNLQLTEQLYRAILQLDPNHPDANHNLGILEVQKNQPAIALSYLLTALDAEPTKAPYWISYIDALILSGQTEDAKQILTLARQQGLEGEKVDALMQRLDANPKEIESTDATIDQSVATPEVSQKTKLKTKPDTNKKKQPGSKEVNALSELFAKGRYSEAAHLAQQMTERFPYSSMGWKALGATYKKMGRNADAMIAMQKAVELVPDDIESLSNLANTLRESGFPEEAVHFFQRVIQINPDDANAYCNLGVTLRQMRRMDEAETNYRRALQIKPLFAEAHNNLGNTLKDMGRLHEAEACYQQALKIKPDYAEAHNNLGATLRELGQTEEAVSCYRRAIQLNPAYAEAHSNLGFALRDLDQFDEALTSCRRALELKPDYADAYANQGGILKELGRIDDAIASCRKAIEINLYLTEAHNNLGNALQANGDCEAAIASFHQTLSLNPDYIKARYNLGYAQLACGQFAEGWKNHEFRTNIDKMRFPTLPFWAGENLAGKSILIWGEQGIGDEIMFASLFSEVIAQAARCTIECAPKLVPLFIRSFPGAHIVPSSNPPHTSTQLGFDYQCAAGSLAQWLRPSIESFPQQNKFLMTDPALVAYWKQRLSELGPEPKIGFCWRSNLTIGERPLHYTELKQWGPIFTTQRMHFINLQYDECSAELDEARQQFAIPLHAFTEVDMYNDLGNTAALIQALDLVISTSTSVYAISAALGVNTWVMNYGTPWDNHGIDHTPWFPSARFFNRRWNQSWTETIETVAQQLKVHA